MKKPNLFVPINGQVCEVSACPNCEGYQPVAETSAEWNCLCGYVGSVTPRPDLS